MRDLYRVARDNADRAPPHALKRTLAAVPAHPGLDATEQAILAYAARLTIWPQSMRASHLEPLRSAGLDDAAISAVNLVTACFAFMNRLADGTGVGLTAERQALAIELFGDDSWTRHCAWVAGTDDT